MSQTGDTSSTGSDPTSGISDSTFSDATLGDQIMGGGSDFTDPSSYGGSAGGGFGTLSSLASALTGGGVAGAGSGVGAAPAATQAASMSPPTAAGATGGDPTGAAGGTQSSTTPGQSSPQQQPQQNQQQQQQYAPPSAVATLTALFKKLSGQPTGPTGPTPQQPKPPVLPTLTPGETGPQSPQMVLPTLSPGETGPQSPPAAAPASPLAQVVGAPAAAARIPPGAAQAPTPTPPPDPRDITVRPKGAPPVTTPPGAADESVPTKKDATPAPAAPTPAPVASRLMQDVTGASTGSPTALADLAQAAQVILPLVLPLLMGGGGRRGGFRGGRFMHGFGGGRGFHPGGRGGWPYHHPVHGWDMHHQHPGGGWLPLNPQQAQAFGLGGGQQRGGQDGGTPNETGAPVGPPDSVGTSGAIPGVGAKQVDDYTRQVATKWGIDPDVASRILAQESSYGQARRPGDNGTSFGPFQLHFAADGRAMGDDFRRDTGLDPRDPSTWKAQIDYAMKRAAMGGWKPWTTTMNKLGLNQWSGITTNRRFAGKLGAEPSPGVQAAAAMPVPAQLPPTSQPMVAGP